MREHISDAKCLRCCFPQLLGLAALLLSSLELGAGSIEGPGP